MLSRLALILALSLVSILPVQAATFTVDSVADTGDFNTADGFCDTDDSVGDGPCTLRAAIDQANFDAVFDTIHFGIAGAGPFVFTPATPYNDFIEPVTLDGSSQPGATCGTDAASRNLLISIDFSAAGGPDGFAFIHSSDNSVLRGLNLFGTGGHAIGVASDDVTLECNHIGTNLAGTAVAAAATFNGILASDSDNLHIGGSSFAAMNVISGMTNDGILFSEGDGLVISGNHIGVDITGVNPLGNGVEGINIDDGGGGIDDVTIGGVTVADRNIVSANGKDGIRLRDITNAIIQNNFVGLDINGDLEGNAGHGIVLIGANNDGLSFLDNVISGNADAGIIADSPSNLMIRGNFIGTSPDGLSDRGNGSSGIGLLGTYTNVRIGGTDPSHRNIISGNTDAGIFSGGLGTVLLIEGNYVGTDITGTAPIANIASGVVINSTANGVRIGGMSPGAGNLISGNDDGVFGSNGIFIAGDGVTVQGNIIGLDASGLNPLSNGAAGVFVSSGVSEALIGGSTAAARNVIASNGFAGIGVLGDGALTSDVVIRGNYIGTDIHGDTKAGLGNGLIAGVALLGDLQDILIGGVNPGESNLIKGNAIGVLSMSFDDTAEIPVNNTLLGNSLFDNVGLGFDLSVNTDIPPDFFPTDFIGTNTNDVGDGDLGPNGLLNHPVIYAISDVGGGNIQVDYFLDVPAGDYRVEFFGNTSLDSNLYGEGETLLASSPLTHTGAGVELFSSTFAGSISDNITATVTEVLTVPANCDENIYYYHSTPADWISGLITPLGGDVYTISYDFVDSTEADRFEEMVTLLTSAPEARADEFIPIAASHFYFHNGHFSHVTRVDADTLSATLDLSAANDVPAALPGSCVDPYLLGDYATSNATLRATYDAMTAGQTAPGLNPVVEISFEVHTFDEFTSRFGSTSEFSSTASTGTTGLDFGDNPDAAGGTAAGDYETRMVDNGAYHTLGNVYLGACVDADNGTLHNASSSADDNGSSPDILGACAVAGDDEDGVTLPSPLNWGTAETLTVIASGAGELNGWIDFNNDGDFTDAGEHIFIDEALVSGVNNLTVNVPAGAGVLSTASRFRFNSAGVNGATFILGPTGESLDGEVEDYPVAIVDSGTASIGDLVWNDLNSDGILGAVETGIDNVTVDLSLDDGDGVYEPLSDDLLLATQTTAGGGLYDFTNLAAAQYWVHVSDQNAVLTGYNKVSGATLPELITVVVGENFDDADYGYAVPPAPGGAGGGGNGGAIAGGRGGGVGPIFDDLVKKNQLDEQDKQDEQDIFVCNDIFDDTSGHIYEADICFLYNIGVLQGRGGIDGIFLPRDSENYLPPVDTLGSYSPDMDVNRIEFLKMILKNPRVDLIETGNLDYSDVSPADWFYKYIDHGTAAGYVEGYKNGTFMPGKSLLNIEAISMLAKIGKEIDHTLTVEDQQLALNGVDQWFEEGLNSLGDNETFNQYFDGPFNPAEVVSRGKAAHVIRAIFYPDSL